MRVLSTKRFTIRRRLGEGGMGVVYEAFDEERRTLVALKTLNRFDGDALARFKREFRALQGLAHPNLVALDELFFENDQWFFTMELLDGVDFVNHVTGTRVGVPFQSTIRESEGKIAAPCASGGEIGAGSSFDEPKLRDGLKQLLDGLSALHAVDKVHRDVKPSNVLVTREGRVVLLDFGLVTAAVADDRSTGNAVVGTPAYMAPEQAASRAVGPPADLYAVGVMLYEVLTGRLPIDGPQLQLLLDKQTREPAAPSSLVAGIPADLDALCVRLLRFDPSKRPDAAEILRSLGRAQAKPSVAPRTSMDAQIFVGRSAELSVLREAFTASANGGLATVLVCGESGIGKSYLVRRFTGQLLAEHPEAMLLEGRCYERETVPYKTLDGIVDALSRRLSRMGAADVDGLLPARSATLAQVFPAMLRVPRVAREHAALTLTVEPHELRRRAFVALREMFSRLAARRPTVVVIDDLQWADDDGLRALAEILRPPEAPSLLLLGTVRVASAEDAGLKRVLSVVPGEPQVIDLTALGREDARALAVAFLRSSDAGEADPEIIASEAGGHPLFVEELARHVALGGSARDEVKLDDAIWSRVVQLEGPTREMAELVAIAGKPIPQEVVAAAAHVEPGEFNRRAATLRVSNLVRTSGARWADAIEPYHDRVREAVLGRMEPERRRTLHEALAIAFEASAHHDPETLAAHWREAGNAARAARYAEAAGDQAARTFAFDRASQWYEQALGLTAEGQAGRRELRIKLGDALAFAGRGALAAPYLQAAAVDSPPMEALELRRRAADQLLRSGHIDAGLEAGRAVLTSIDLRLPQTKLGVVVALLFFRLVLAARGLRFHARERAQITAEELARIDTCHMLGYAFGWLDPLLGVVFQTRDLLFALSAGELERIVRALGVEIVFSAMSGPSAWRRTKRLIDRSQELADRAGGAHAQFWATGPPGMAIYLSGRFLDAVPPLVRALEQLQDGSTGLVHEKHLVRYFLMATSSFLGRIKEIQRQQEEGLREASARGDIYGAVLMTAWPGHFGWLARDRPDVAEEQLRVAIAQWSTRRFDILHFCALLARVYGMLYRGSAAEASALAAEACERTRATSMWRIHLNRVSTLHLRGLTAILLAEREPQSSAALLRRAASDARELDREGVPSSRPFATLIRAGIALRNGARDEAIRGLDNAVREFEAVGVMGHAFAARDRAARLRADATSAADIERAAAFFRGEDVVNPERFIAMLVPGFAAGS